MAGTNAVAFITAAVALLKPALAPPSAGYTQQVRVDDAYNGRLQELEYVYFGHSAGPHEPMTFRGGGRLPRHEELIVKLHVEVAKNAASTIDTANRAVQIGQTIEETFANDPQLGGVVAGLMGAVIVHSDLVSFFMDDGRAASQLEYQIHVESRLG